MKLKRKMKKSLAAAAMLAAMAVTATSFAMPSGGTVVVGGNQITIGDGAAGILNIGVNAHGVIDWNSFSIAQGETVNFNFANMGTNASLAVLNRVSGSEMSSLLGTLNATNHGNVFLVNPNGILVGAGAQINTSNLVLSTLDISNDNFMKIFTDGYVDESSTLNFAKGNKAIAADINIEGNLQNVHYLGLIGGKVTVAPNVTISAGANESFVNILAADEANVMVAQTADGIGNDDITHIATQAGNAVQLQGNIASAYITAVGGNVALDGATITGGIVDLEAVQRHTSDDPNNKVIFTATSNNVLRADNTDIRALNLAALVGGQVTANGTEVSLGQSDPSFNNKAVIIAAQKAEITAADNAPFSKLSIEAGKDNAVSLNTSTVNSSDDAADIFILGGKTNLTDAALTGNEIFIGAGSDLALEAAPNEETGGYYDEFWFADSGKTAAGNDIAFDGSSVLTANGESAVVGNKITNAGQIISHHPYGISLMALHEYNLGGDSVSVVFSKGNELVNTGTITADQSSPDVVSEPGIALTGIAGSIKNEGTINAGTANFYAAGTIDGIAADATTSVKAEGLNLGINDYKMTLDSNWNTLTKEALPSSSTDTNAAIDEIINSSSTLEEKQQSVSAVITAINNSADTQAAKDAAVKSAIASIQSSSLNDADKKVLLSSVTGGYTGTASTETEADNQVVGSVGNASVNTGVTTPIISNEAGENVGIQEK